MLENVVTTMICSQWDHTLGRRRPEAGVTHTPSDSSKAMVVKFALNFEAGEQGYRNLSIMLFGGGTNYIGVFAKLDWAVAQTSEDDPEDAELEYTQGDTGWVLVGYHDSCWSDAVGGLIWNFRSRINSLDWVFDGWYKIVELKPEERVELQDLVQAFSAGAVAQTLQEREFHFPLRPLQVIAVNQG